MCITAKPGFRIFSHQSSISVDAVLRRAGTAQCQCTLTEEYSCFCYSASVEKMSAWKVCKCKQQLEWEDIYSVVVIGPKRSRPNIPDCVFTLETSHCDKGKQMEIFRYKVIHQEYALACTVCDWPMQHLGWSCERAVFFSAGLMLIWTQPKSLPEITPFIHSLLHI